MKIYRIIGTVLSVLLAIIFAVEIFALTAVYGAAKAVNKETISDITDAFLDNEDLYGSVTETISKEVSVNITNAISENLSDSSISLNEQTVEKAVNEILNSDAFKTMISDVTSDLVIGMMSPTTENIEVNVSEKLGEMFTNNPETFNTIIEEAASDSGATYDDFYNAASAYMSQSGTIAPEHGTSYSEMIAAVVSSNNDMFNSLLNDYLAAVGFSLPTETTDPDTDYAPVDSEAEVSAEDEIAAIQVLMKEVGIVVDFLKSPVYILIICSTLLLFFGISALLTWSVKRSLLISGIMTAISAIMLFIMGSIKFPTALLLPILEESFGTAAITAHDILAIAWGSATSNITVCGLIALATSFLLIGGFILWYTLAKKKKSITTT